MQQINVPEHFNKGYPVIDVRSPVEFISGHIPGSINLPLFTDEERKIVGITYKTQGKRLAIEKGLELVQLPQIVQKIRGLNLSSSVIVYCARGGMRSASMAWMLNLLGFETYTINGGYKSFRKWVLDQFSTPYHLIVLGGKTGSKKTKILNQLSIMGEHIIDFEKMAHHRGSVFGQIDEQPTQEQFENDLSLLLREKNGHPIWVEDESERIGSLVIPRFFFQQMKEARMIVLDIPLELRMKECIDEYRPLGTKQLSIAIHRLQKRLGGLESKKALLALEQNQLDECCRILLRYYDKKYLYGIRQRNPDRLLEIHLEENSVEILAQRVQESIQSTSVKSLNRSLSSRSSSS
jgi:tRNA 2-selenouridine synthase